MSQKNASSAASRGAYHPPKDSSLLRQDCRKGKGGLRVAEQGKRTQATKNRMQHRMKISERLSLNSNHFALEAQTPGLPSSNVVIDKNQTISKGCDESLNWGGDEVVRTLDFTLSQNQCGNENRKHHAEERIDLCSDSATESSDNCEIVRQKRKREPENDIIDLLSQDSFNDLPEGPDPDSRFRKRHEEIKRHSKYLPHFRTIFEEHMAKK